MKFDNTIEERIVGFEDRLDVIHDSRLFDYSVSVYFSNDYGASIIKYVNSVYYEVAVLSYNGEEWVLDYGTGITDDVIAGLDTSGVMNIVKQISEI